MQTNRITRNYQRRVEPIKPAVKPRREKQSFVKALKKQAKSDPLTHIMIILAFIFGTAMIVSQALIGFGVITGPVYL
jgi:cytoskeletal protein RodZ